MLFDDRAKKQPSFFGERELSPEEKYDQQQQYIQNTLRNESPTSREIRLGKERLINNELIKQIKENGRRNEGPEQSSPAKRSSPDGERQSRNNNSSSVLLQTSPGRRTNGNNTSNPRISNGMISPYRRKYEQIQDERRFDKMVRDRQRSSEKNNEFEGTLQANNSRQSPTRSPQKVPTIPSHLAAAGGPRQRQRSRDLIEETQDMMVDRRNTIRSQDKEEERQRRRQTGYQPNEQQYPNGEEAKRVSRGEQTKQPVLYDTGSSNKNQSNQKTAPSSTQGSGTRSPTRYYSPTNRSPPRHDCTTHTRPSAGKQQHQHQHSPSRNSPPSSHSPSAINNNASTDVQALQKQMTREISKMQEELGELRQELTRQKRSNGDLMKEVQRVEGNVIPREVDRIESRLERQNKVISTIDPVSPVVERRIVNRVKNDLSTEFNDRQKAIIRDQDNSNRELINQQKNTQRMLRDLSTDMDIKEIKDESRHRAIQRAVNNSSAQGNMFSNAAKRSLSNSFSMNDDDVRPSPYGGGGHAKYSAQKDPKQLPYIDNQQVFLPTSAAFYSDINQTPGQGGRSSVVGGRTPSSTKQPLSRLSANKNTQPFEGNVSGDFGGQRRQSLAQNTGIPSNLDILDTIVIQSNQGRSKVQPQQPQRSAQKQYSTIQQNGSTGGFQNFSTIQQNESSPGRRGSNLLSQKQNTIAGKIINDLDGLLKDVKVGGIA